MIRWRKMIDGIHDHRVFGLRGKKGTEIDF
jgi:hypothetical protein